MKWILPLAMIFVLAACNNQEPANESKKESKNAQEETTATIVTELTEPVEIEFWNAMNGASGEALQALTDEFNEKNENITVTLVNQGGYRDLFDKLMGAAKANQLPAMTQIYSNRLSWYVSKGLVEDLSLYMEDETIGLSAEDKNDFPKLFLDDGTWMENNMQCHLIKVKWSYFIM